MHPALRHSAIPLDALHPPKADGTGAGVALSIVVHIGLVTALTLGVQWRSQSDEGVEAELWASVPQLAAPPAEAPPPQQPAEAPAPPPPQPTKASPPPPPPQAAQRDADIALEQAKKAKLEKQRQAEAEKRAEAKKQAEQDKLEKAKEDKARKDKADKEQAAKDKAEQDRKEKLAAKEKAKAEAAAEAAEEAAREKARQAHLQRMKEQLSGSGGPQSTGTAAKSAGPSAGYAGRIKARIRPNIRLLDPISGNPEATVEVKVTPDGTIIGRRLMKPSGDKAWDEAVLRAIDRTERLPRDTDGSIPPVFEIKFTPQD
ncbi:cell envelope integrity protein TolA [Ideonella paludis]|uniref:Cell envelope integrity protein TolA n=1 Tax=Ideonella paludis TaxID=1233411 RepID=A0ABS5E2K2_9BURK|nr:cell envelope integrity protein TolA [Ideonella paludis]MBQ0937645.1 cell envelope integrity protein TolA [Ideonella paludis]